MNIYYPMIEMIKQHEGLRLKPYKCTAGKVTIGYGRNLEDVGIREREADLLLENDIKDSMSYVNSYNFHANGFRKAALVDMMYNLGPTRFAGFKKMIAAINECDFDRAADEMLDSKWSKQVGARAVRLAEIMRTGRM